MTGKWTNRYPCWLVYLNLVIQKIQYICYGEFNSVLWNWLDSIQTNIYSIGKHGNRSRLRQNHTLSSCSSYSAPSRLSECIRSLVFRDLSKSALTATLLRIHWDIGYFGLPANTTPNQRFFYLAHDTVAPGGR